MSSVNKCGPVARVILCSCAYWEGEDSEPLAIIDRTTGSVCCVECGAALVAAQPNPEEKKDDEQ